MKRTDRILLTLTVVMTVALAWVVAGTLGQPVVNASDRAPSFTAVTDQGVKISPSQFGGKLLVLNFWATWCAGCVEEITSLDAFQRKFASDGVVVLGVSMDQNENRYKSFLRRFPVAFATMRDASWDISSSYGTFQLPETYIIDRSGKVLEKIIAAHNFMEAGFIVRIQRQLK